jgi:hypothetical protein
VKCGLAGTHGPDPVAVACYGKSKRRIEAKQLVLAPCSVLPCTWWAERKVDIENLENWAAEAHGMNILWI